jgi:hypothetical protein
MLMLFVYSVGGHFNPRSTRHGSPDDEENERVCLLHNMLSVVGWGCVVAENLILCGSVLGLLNYVTAIAFFEI